MILLLLVGDVVLCAVVIVAGDVTVVAGDIVVSDTAFHVGDFAVDFDVVLLLCICKR